MFTYKKPKKPKQTKTKKTTRNSTDKNGLGETWKKKIVKSLTIGLTLGLQ